MRYPPLEPMEGTEGDILHAIANLSNFVLAAGAMNNLKRIRNRSPRHFSSLVLFHRALRLISSNHYQAPVRRFVLDLFQIKITADTVAQLVRLERESLSSRTESAEKESGYEPDHELEMRRRSASSPGPEPAARSGQTGRTRGLTISAIQNGFSGASGSGGGGGEYRHSGGQSP